VFDTRQPTFRDKLFEKYKASARDAGRIVNAAAICAAAFARRCGCRFWNSMAMKRTMLSGAWRKKRRKENLDVLLGTNDKDMMQLVDGNVRVLRAGTGGAKNDVIVDVEKVKEILGVPPEKVVDVMALMGDTIDNIPGAKGIGKRARPS